MSGKLEEVKTVLHSLVLSEPIDMTMEKLNRDYKVFEGEFVPFRLLGYGSLEHFLKSIPETLRVIGTGPTAMVCLVGNEKSAHIHEMIAHQNKSKSSRKRNRAHKNRSYEQNSIRHYNNKYPSNRNYGTSSSSHFQFNHYQPTNRQPLVKTLTYRETRYKYTMPPEFERNTRSVSSSSKEFYSTNGQIKDDKYLNAKENRQSEGTTNTLQNIPSVKKATESANWNVKNETTAEKSHCVMNSSRTNSLQNLPPVKKATEPANWDAKNENTAEKSHCVMNSSRTVSHNNQNHSTALIHKKEDDVSQLERLMNTMCHTTTTRRTTINSPPRSQTKVQPVQRTILEAEKPSENCTKSVQFSLAALSDSDRSHKSNINKPKHKLSKEASKILNSSAVSERRRNPIRDIESDIELDQDEVCLPPLVNNKPTPPETHMKPNEIFDISIQTIQLDEAIPESAISNLVLSVDFPNCTVPYGIKIPPFILPDEICIGNKIKIFISEIHNPFKFWFHFHKEEHALDILMNKIEHFYKTLDIDSFRLPLKSIVPGQICAASYLGMWHRAEIIAKPSNNKVKLFFLDYGTVCAIDLRDIKYLHRAFVELPAQAMRGCLSHIKPRGLHWSHEATYCFLGLVSELLLFGLVTDIDRESKTIYMILCDSNTDNVININETLVKRSLALSYDEWDELKIKKNDGRHVHHPREDFPTFSMLESGEYPNYTELVDLKHCGIDYEIIYDRIIFQPDTILNKHDNVPAMVRNLPFFLLKTNPFRTDIMELSLQQQ